MHNLKFQHPPRLRNFRIKMYHRKEIDGLTDRQIRQEMDSIEVGSNDSKVPNTVFSPRKTRVKVL